MQLVAKRVILVSAIVLGSACMPPKLKTISTNPDGSQVVGIPDMNLQLTVPAGARLTSTSASASVIQWADNAQGVRVEKRNTTKHADAAALTAELQTRYKLFEANATETLPNGFDVAYTHRTNVTPERGYEAEVTVGNNTLGCYLTAGTTDAALETARTACRSLAASN